MARAVNDVTDSRYLDLVRTTIPAASKTYNLCNRAQHTAVRG